MNRKDLYPQQLLDRMAGEYENFERTLARFRDADGRFRAVEREDIKAVIDDIEQGFAGRDDLFRFTSAGIGREPLRAPVSHEGIRLQFSRLIETMRPVLDSRFRIGFAFVTRAGGEKDRLIKFREGNVAFFALLHMPQAEFYDDNSLTDIVSKIEKLPRCVLAGEPDVLLLLGSQIKVAKNIMVVMPTGQSLLPTSRGVLADVYEAEVFEAYWTAETGPLAVECPEHHGMHVLAPDVAVEITDDFFRRVDPVQYGHTLVTSRLNPLLPFARYRTGDQARLTFEKCPCGNPAPFIRDIAPAYADLYNRAGENIIPPELVRLLGNIPVLQFQVIQKDGYVDCDHFSMLPDDEMEPKIDAILKSVFSSDMPFFITSGMSPGEDKKFHRITASRPRERARVSIMRLNEPDNESFAVLMDTLLKSLKTPRGTFGAGGGVIVIPPSRCDSDKTDPLLEQTLAWAEARGYECSIQRNEDTEDADSGAPIINLGVFDPAAETFSGATDGLKNYLDVDVERAIDYIKADSVPVLNLFRVKQQQAGEKDESAATLFAGSWNAAALDRILAGITGKRVSDVPELSEAAKVITHGALLEDILLFGLQPEVARKPAPVIPAESSDERVIDCFEPLCTACGLCARVCPESCIEIKDGKLEIFAENCIRCYCCVEYCAEGALSPIVNRDAVITGIRLSRMKDWLTALAHDPGDRAAIPAPPAFLSPPDVKKNASRKEIKKPPLYILGLAITTMQENAAALLKDGEIVGAVEEERFRRRKHYGWRPPGRPGITVSNDPCIRIEEAFCGGAIKSLLDMEGITLEDVDYIAVNGIPWRFRPTYLPDSSQVPLKIIAAGKLIYVPHHLSHAASAYRVSGFDRADIYTVDGSGDNLTAAYFKAVGPDIKPVIEAPTRTECSIGGGYETATAILGFGPHGQGSTMALAGMGEPTVDLSSCYTVTDAGDVHVNTLEMNILLDEYRRSRLDPLEKKHCDLAASVQKALEDINLAIVRTGMGSEKPDTICLAGGVALNCTMNQRLRAELGFGDMFIQPGAQDAGTALGAALEAHRFITGENPRAVMKDAYLGPGYSEDEIRSELELSGLEYKRSEDIAADTAALLADGKIVCWYQGRLEFGPRALGNRSILADPSRANLKRLLNEKKSREPWRPFGPSILKGYESEYFEHAFYSPFMLFTFTVKKEKREQLPAIVHEDGTTRPQVVDPRVNPLFYSLIEKFREITSIPMVVNTSFNTGDEPIVCTPEDAVRNFLRLEADYLAIGNFIVENKLRGESDRATRREAALKEIKKTDAGPADGRRLHLRLTTRCDNYCHHCTVADIRDKKERATESAIYELACGRKHGCSELVFMRGEPLLRNDLPLLVREARGMGYTHIQLQTNGRRLSDEKLFGSLIESGVNFFEISLYGDTPRLHDAVARAENAHAETIAGIKNVLSAGIRLIVTVPVVELNFSSLPDMVNLLEELGVRNVQFNFSRPVNIDVESGEEPLDFLESTPYISKAIRAAGDKNITATTEGVPFCHLDNIGAGISDSEEDWRRHRIADLHIVHDNMTEHRAESRPSTPRCIDCAFAGSCPRTWQAYIEHYGATEFRPIY